MSRTPAADQLALFAGYDIRQLEAVIERGLETFVEVGLALGEIKRRKLHRDAGYTDFDAYCRERWGMSRAYADRTVNAASLVHKLAPIGAEIDPPPTESVARELAPLRHDEAELVSTWRELREQHGDKITASTVRAAHARSGISGLPALEHEQPAAVLA